jgi:hypothetical protein
MTLNELYRPGTKLKDVPYDFEGMPVKQWLRLQMDQDFASPKGKIPDGAPGTQWRKKAIATSRDNYGMKGPRV